MLQEMSVELCSDTDEDLSLLAVMNKQLIEDEQHDNPMSAEELKDRMKTFLATDYSAYFFMCNASFYGEGELFCRQVWAQSNNQ